MATSGYLLYRGPSSLDGSPVVAVATAGSRNVKTGSIVQTWILSDVGELPHVAQRTGADVAVCGDCPLRPANGGGCYVLTWQGPRGVYDAYRRGRYADVSGDPAGIATVGAGRHVRLGAYGDPAAVPHGVWRALLSRSRGWTGYTHQWRHADVLRDICMASVGSPGEAAIARSRGWRTFRIRAAADPLLPREGVCPASTEAGHVRTCETCGICDGSARGSGRASIAIVAHGWTAKRALR